MLRKVLNGVRNPRRSASYLADKLRKLRYRKDDFVGVYFGRNGALADYVLFVTRAARDYRVFARFKSDPNYRKMLEHVTREQGEKYLAVIKDQSPEFFDQFDRFKINDLVGTPITHSYPIIGTFSPTTLRYIKVASDLQKYFGFNIGEKIAEIGGGYGGRLLINRSNIQNEGVSFI